MVMRQRSGGIAAARPQQTNHRMYEDFRPTFERKEEEATHVITLRLPGFAKEQIRITSGHNPRMVRIRGERPILNNKRSRFYLEIPVLENCDLNKIQSKFQNGILTIIMPKDVPPKLLTPEDEVAKTIPGSTHSITSKAPVDQPAKQTERQKFDQKTTSDQTKAQKGKEKETVQKAKTKPKSRKVEDKVSSKQEIPSTSKAPELPKPQKVQDSSVSKPTLITAGADKQKDDKSAIVSSIAQKPSADQPNIQNASRKEAVQKAMTEPNAQKVDEKKLREVKERTVERTLQKEKEREDQKLQESTVSADHEKVVPKIKEGKETNNKKIDGFEEEKIKEEYNITAKYIMGIKNVKETAKETMENVPKGVNDEERQLLVNVGAAVLVLVGFGIYVSYSFGSFGQSKN